MPTTTGLPLCQACNFNYATSFGPDDSMMCPECRTADDETPATEAGDPAAWVVSSDGEVTAPPAFILPTVLLTLDTLLTYLGIGRPSVPFRSDVIDVELPGMWECADFIDTSEDPQPADLDEPAADAVNHPSHYTSHPSGVECITITEHMGFNLGNALKYIWRCDLKNDAIEDLRKARFYIDREIAKREHAAGV
ncbi:hypothetical protein PBI_OMNICRON_49 [Mycobacterium phage Omnicron]|uniref:DUF3310 domain-containing protein n=1 Tax=Mycobacterium phage Omnicron TaxID=1541819 RepID=A0A088FRG2_9CAUD|nr:hypothetical protein PBI_OMNICRON_49 [Mycobacterium phage Omnicron]AIM50382.1 hypothetical protein PBI_OMNICRON_49 [Mycobacterium phage Omnicron]